MSILIICEKPSVAKTIAGALGAKEQKDGYIQGNGLLVSWCMPRTPFETQSMR